MSDIMRLAQSPAGKQLMALLQQKNPDDLQKAMRKASSGDYAGAQSQLAGLMDSPEARELLKQLGG